MDYETYRTRTEARETARKMRKTGWPQATATPILQAPDWDAPRGTPDRTVWIVRASRQPEQYLRADGFVR